MSDETAARRGPLVTVSGERLQVGSALGKGGQGVVYSVANRPGTALKLYFDSQLAASYADLRDRLSAMTARPPINPTAALGHESLAWPSDVVHDNRGQFAGFLMPLLDTRQSVALHHLVNPSDRKRVDPKSGLPPWLPAFDDWKRLVRVATNLSACVRSIHEPGYVIGDFNESNVLVTDKALVTVIDCDSMQVTGPDGTLHLCPVGKPEFTPPEAHGHVRDPNSDTFALAIHVFTLLMQGRHPFSGKWSGPGDKPPQRDLARMGVYCLSQNSNLTLPPAAPPASLLPQPVRDLFDRAFIVGARNPDARPTAAEWHQALSTLETQLVSCPKVRGHSYPQHLNHCPWCAKQPAPTQKPLPPSPLPPSPPPPPSLPPPPPLPSGWAARAGRPARGRAGGWNGMAIAALVSCVVFPFVSLVLGLIALSRIRRSGQRGRRGAIIAIVWGALIWLLVIVGALIPSPETNATTGEPFRVGYSRTDQVTAFTTDRDAYALLR